jgi:hypothetical protein
LASCFSVVTHAPIGCSPERNVSFSFDRGRSLNTTLDCYEAGRPLGRGLGIFFSRPAAAEEQLPINELGACEIVLHELIADLTRVQRTSRKESPNSRDEEPSLYNTRHQAMEEAFAQAIRLAKAKYGRCP